MDCATLEQADQVAARRPSRWFTVFVRRLSWLMSRPDRLDLEGMPDRVKRDLGFMDGREPRYQAELWR